ncbi:hypothetical protein [Streptomyces sp. NPDC054940]
MAQIDSTVRVDSRHDMSDAADELYGADAETLRDGTKVATRQGPGDKAVAASVCGPSTPCGTTVSVS